MKLLLIISLLISSLLLQSTVYASSHPQGNFVLAGGQYRVSDESDPFEKIDKKFFSTLIIPVKDGDIDFYNTRPIDLESGKQHYKGTISLNLKGNYDKDTGAINARFIQSGTYTYERKTDSGFREGNGEFGFSGKTTGTVIDDLVVLSFEGALSDKAISQADDKSIDSTANSGTPWVKKVQFGTSEWTGAVNQEQATAEITDDSGARFSDLSGQIEMWCPPNEGAWDVVKMGTIIRVNCHIKTDEDSTAKISFSDMTTFEMKPESEIVIDTPPQKDSKLKLLAGNIWANVKKMVKDGTMEVHMGQAVAGIKGTTLVLEEKEGISTLKVIEGLVEFKSSVTQEVKTVSSGQALSATSAGLQQITDFDIELESKNWADNRHEIIKTQTDEVAKITDNTTKSNPDSINVILLIGALALAVIIVLIRILRKKRILHNT